MAERVEALAPGLRDFPWGSAAPPRMVGVLNDLHARQAEIVTVDDLASHDTGLAAEETARLLRRNGWIHPLRTRGAWSVNFVWSPTHFGRFRELRARLRTHPDTPAAIAGKSVAQIHGWLRRGAAPTIGCPPRHKLPRCLNDYRVCRWEPRIPLDVLEGLPVWKPETLLVFMASQPSQFQWDDISEWLWEACDRIDKDLLRSELNGRPRSAWAKTAYLIDAGHRPDTADDLMNAAPAEDTGPYVLGHREKHSGRFAYPPAWSSKFNVTDYLLPAWWVPKW